MWDNADPFARLAAMEHVRKGTPVNILATRFDVPADDVELLSGEYVNHPDFLKWLTDNGHVVKMALYAADRNTPSPEYENVGA